MTVGGILGESWRLYTKFFTRFFVVAAIVFLVINLIGAPLLALLFLRPVIDDVAAWWRSSREQ